LSPSRIIGEKGVSYYLPKMVISGRSAGGSRFTSTVSIVLERLHAGRAVEMPSLGGLHHRYDLAA
jgi:hypothetical protein